MKTRGGTLRILTALALAAALALPLLAGASEAPALPLLARASEALAPPLPALASDDAGRASFRKTPYLVFNGVPDEMDVHWQMLSAVPCTLDYGTDTSYALGSFVTAEYGASHQHEVTLMGLDPDTFYFYRVRTGDSRAGSFRSAPSSDSANLKFLAYGDTRTYPADYDDVAAGMIQTYTDDPEFQTLAVISGDLVEDGNIENQWDTQFFGYSYPNIKEFHAEVPSQSCRGNHEGTAVLFAKYLPYPTVISQAWSFDYGPAHFAVLDQYISYFPGSLQLTWLENDLASSHKPWKFIVLHEPGWSAGGHSNDADVQNYIQPLCLQYGVQIIFGGHNHYYARAVVDGVQHITTGGGGAPLYTPDPGYPFIVATAELHHFCTVDIAEDHLHFEAIDTTGAVIDSFDVTLASVPDGGQEQAHLSLRSSGWNPSSGLSRLAFTLPAAGRARLVIYDVSGRVVATLADEPMGAGEHSAVWNGRDDSGASAAAGVYFARLTAGDETAVTKMVLAR